MKIGILTFQASHNCGSMLQAYALREVIARKYNADVEIINYSNYVSRCIYGYLDTRPKRSSIERNMATFTHLKTVTESRKWYKAFSENYLVKSKEYCQNPKDLRKISAQYDMIIAGGDQIWNVRCQDAGKEFFLNFTDDVRKVAYSPSLGGSNILKHADNLELYKQYLLDFDHLSVREPNGQKWLQELTGIEVPIICDPTMLLTAEEWCRWLPVPEIEGKFIFNYAFYHNRPETNAILQKISEKTGMPIYVIDYKSYDYYKLSRYGIKRCSMSGPLAFLGLMKNASLVLTQSFHGTLFSSLFNRNFWSYNWKEAHNPDDDRAMAILEQLGLEDRYKMIDELLDIDLFTPVDYETVNEKIANFRAISYQYIDSFMK